MQPGVRVREKRFSHCYLVSFFHIIIIIIIITPERKVCFLNV